MTSPARVFAILDLFTQQRPAWHPDEINEALGYARATGYRYVRELVEAGFLQKVAAGRYTLGARIIELDFQLRHSDPVLLAAMPVMAALADRTRLDAVLTTLFSGDQIVDTHRAFAPDKRLALQYGRGRPRPLLRGAAPKILVAHLPRTALMRLYERHADEIAALGEGQTWPEFRAAMTAVRAAGLYVSLGELDPGVGAAAVPVINAEGDVVAALALVGTVEQLQQHGAPALKTRLDEASQAIHARLRTPDGT